MKTKPFRLIAIVSRIKLLCFPQKCGQTDCLVMSWFQSDLMLQQFPSHEHSLYKRLKNESLTPNSQLTINTTTSIAVTCKQHEMNVSRLAHYEGVSSKSVKGHRN